jgi:hypothetical protein
MTAGNQVKMESRYVDAARTSKLFRLSLAIRLCSLFLLWSATAEIACSQIGRNTDGFLVHDHDRVVFYGDSVTAQARYTNDIELYIDSRYPGWEVDFSNSGYGGDTVQGGGAGNIDTRLEPVMNLARVAWPDLRA